MKALTHYLFSIGVSLFLLSLAHAVNLGTTTMALWLSIAINYLVDALGHESRRGHPTRTWLTHSIVTAPIWGAGVAIISLTALSQAGVLPSLSAEPLLWTTMGILISGEHLFLDSLTQAGIYSWKKRIALARFRYDNVALNLGFALVGALLIAATLGV